MLRSVNSVVGYAIRATDGDLGKVDGFFFDDETWTIRYLVVNTGSWLAGRRVLLAPVALGKADWESRTFRVNLTMEQVRSSPEIDTAKPVSREHEEQLYGHYAWPMYWGSGMSSGFMFLPSTSPIMFDADRHIEVERDESEPEPEASHLRSTHGVAGYHIAAVDGDVGHVADYIIDDQTWLVRFLVVDTHNWLPGRKVLIAPQWVESMEGREAEVIVDLTREAIKSSPEYDPTEPVNTDYEGRLYDYYGRPRQGGILEPVRG